MTESFSDLAETEAMPPAPVHPAQGVSVPSEVPAEGTSEAAAPVDGVRATTLTPEGLADGETDVRVPPTTTF